MGVGPELFVDRLGVLQLRDTRVFASWSSTAGIWWFADNTSRWYGRTKLALLFGNPRRYCSYPEASTLNHSLQGPVAGAVHLFLCTV